MRTIIYTCMIFSLLLYFDKVNAGKYSKDKEPVIFHKIKGIGIDSKNNNNKIY